VVKGCSYRKLLVRSQAARDTIQCRGQIPASVCIVSLDVHRPQHIRISYVSTIVPFCSSASSVALKIICESRVGNLGCNGRPDLTRTDGNRGLRLQAAFQF